MSKILILKLSREAYTSIDFNLPLAWPSELKLKLSGPWRLNAHKLLNTAYVIAMYNGRVLTDYTLDDKCTIDQQKQLISDLILTDAENRTGLVSEYLDYKTANPATFQSLDKLEKRVIDDPLDTDITYDLVLPRGSAKVRWNHHRYDFHLETFSEGDYGDVGLDITSDIGNATISQIFNVNTLPVSWPASYGRNPARVRIEQQIILAVTRIVQNIVVNYESTHAASNLHTDYEGTHDPNSVHLDY